MPIKSCKCPSCGVENENCFVISSLIDLDPVINNIEHEEININNSANSNNTEEESELI